MSNIVMGINYVRPPVINITKKNVTKDYTKYEIETKHKSKYKLNENDYINYLDSFIFCKDKLTIRVPTKKFCKRNGKSKFAYVVGLFPNPKTGKATYLDGCILCALGLRRQKTNADIICMVTPDIQSNDISKLEVVFDKVITVPYISPYKMEGSGKDKTILIDKGIFKNCNNYTKNHPYVHVFFKLHIFNSEYFPYDKVCFVDSDLVPLNYYDSLFMIDTPAGWVEYRKKPPYLEAFHWDRCDFLKHGHKIPKIFTDIDKPAGSDVNAGLLLVKPDMKEYNSMLNELKKPVSKWMGSDKEHKGFYNFDFDSITGSKFIEGSYCYPEQNYLTKRFSGKWSYIEFAFQSWSLDPCNSFGIHMAAFNPKPWFKQPAKGLLISKEKESRYIKNKKKPEVNIALAIKEDNNYNYENISYSYEIFNDLIIWGMIQYKELHKFFMHDTQIWGTKISFDGDKFKPLDNRNNIKYLTFGKFNKENLYNKLSISQQYIVDLINNYELTSKSIIDKYLSICRTKVKNRYGDFDYDFSIINYPNVNPSTIYDSIISGGKKYKNIMVSNDFDELIIKPKKSKKSTKSKKSIKTTLIYAYMKGCPYCDDFDPIWNQLKRKCPLNMKRINGPINSGFTNQHSIQSYPTLLMLDNKGVSSKFEGERNIDNIISFINKNI